MSKNSKDSLFRFLESKLKGSKDNVGPWNTPPDSVFDNAMTEVNKLKNNNGRRKLFPFFLLFGFGLLLLVAIMAFYRINSLNTKVQTLEEYVISIQSEQRINELQGVIKKDGLSVVSSLDFQKDESEHKIFSLVNDSDKENNTSLFSDIMMEYPFM